MDTSVAAVRQLSLGLRAWKSSGDTFNALFLQAYNLTLTRLSGELREAFLPDWEHVVLHPPHDTTATDVSVYFQATGDPWVLKITDQAGDPLGTSTLTSWRPAVDGTWDGTMHLEVLQRKDPALNPTAVDNWARRQSREWWTDSDEYYVSLDRPWRNATDFDMQGHIFQPEIFTRADVAELLLPLSVWDANRSQCWPLSAVSARTVAGVDFQRSAKGAPAALWRDRHYQMPTPTSPIATTAGGGGSWVGPVQEGDFEFCQTWCYGVLDPEWRTLPGGLRQPLWESAPSPVSAAFSHAAGTNAGKAILITPMHHSAMQGFAEVGALRQHRNGWYTRVYVRRTAVRTAGAGSWNAVEISNVFYPLFDIPSGVTSKSWTGADVPDALARLVHSKGYYAWKVTPHQDMRYELDIPVVRRPNEMVDDADTAPLKDDAFPVFLELLLHYLSLLDGVDRDSAAIHLAQYNTQAAALRSGPVAGGTGEVTAFPMTSNATPRGAGLRAGRYMDS